MIVLIVGIVVLVVAVLIGIAGCLVLLGVGAIRRQQAELVRIEQSKRAAERRLRDLGRQAVTEMLVVARHAEPNEHPGGA